MTPEISAQLVGNIHFHAYVGRYGLCSKYILNWTKTSEVSAFHFIFNAGNLLFNKITFKGSEASFWVPLLH